MDARGSSGKVECNRAKRRNGLAFYGAWEAPASPRGGLFSGVVLLSTFLVALSVSFDGSVWEAFSCSSRARSLRIWISIHFSMVVSRLESRVVIDGSVASAGGGDGWGVSTGGLTGGVSEVGVGLVEERGDSKAASWEVRVVT